jgi:hypothetical protein
MQLDEKAWERLRRLDQVGRAHLVPEEERSLSSRSDGDMSASPGGWKPINSKSLT